MTITNGTGVVSQMALQLALCPSVIAVGIGSGEIWYPTIPMQSATLPAILVVEKPQERLRYAEGALPLIGGTILVQFYSDTYDVGQMENFARELIKDLGSQYYGLCFKQYSVGLCSDPTPGQRAAAVDGSTQKFRQITVTITYGLSR